MFVTGAVVLALAGAATILTGVRPSLAQPPVTTRTNQDFPDFNTDPVQTIGAVTVVNEPLVHARQADAWVVSVVGQPVVGSPTPGFLVVGVTYVVSWAGSAAAGRYRVRALGNNGWIQVEDVADQNRAVKWLNTSLAATIEVAPR
jgi:hypothetical protein